MLNPARIYTETKEPPVDVSLFSRSAYQKVPRRVSMKLRGPP